MKDHPLSLIDDNEDNSSQTYISSAKQKKSIKEEDISTDNTLKINKKYIFHEKIINDKNRKIIPQQRIVFDFKNKFSKESSTISKTSDTNIKVGLIDDSNEETKKDKSIEEKKIDEKNNNDKEQTNTPKDKLAKNLIEKRDKRFSYHGKIYFFCAVTMLIYQYLSYIYFIEFPIIQGKQINTLYIIRIIFFNILIILLAGSLYMTSKTNPGTTPVYWGFHIGDEDFKKKRYCLLCQVFKPERTHHCSICNLCILNMDHHCPWVDNCIGFYNKKFFIQLLCYFFLISFSLCITYFPYSFDIIKIMYKIYKKEILDKKIENKYYLILVNNILLIGFSIVDFNFLKFHIKLIKSNLTTIETLDNDLMQNKKYDMGLEINFKQIFGENKLLWFLPINLPSGYPVGDGLSWPNKFDDIPLDNLNNNNYENNTIDNDNNINEKMYGLNINTATNNKDSNNNTDEKIIKNNSFYGRISQIKTSPQTEKISNNQRFSSNFSKYNVVKRNSGNYNSNMTGFETNSTKKTNFGKGEDKNSK